MYENKKVFILLVIVVGLILLNILLFTKSNKNENASDIEIKRELVTNDPILLHLKQECENYNIDVFEMIGLIYVESRFRTKAVSYLGIDYGYGLMQVSKVCLKDYNDWNGTLYTQRDLKNPYTNITIGVWVYNQNKRYMKTCDSDSLLSAYNVGARNTKENGLNYSYINKVKNAKDKIIIEDIEIK